jgi:hypothetical protein
MPILSCTTLRLLQHLVGRFALQTMTTSYHDPHQTSHVVNVEDEHRVDDKAHLR